MPLTDERMSCKKPLLLSLKRHDVKQSGGDDRWNYGSLRSAKHQIALTWATRLRSHYDRDERIDRVFKFVRNKSGTKSGLAVPAKKLKPSQLRARFSHLVSEWRRDTSLSSSLDEKILHPAYQSIIAMGITGVPLVLKELESNRGHWSWALHFMTGVDPVPEGSNVSEARQAWLEWGRREGMLN